MCLETSSFKKRTSLSSAMIRATSANHLSYIKEFPFVYELLGYILAEYTESKFFVHSYAVFYYSPRPGVSSLVAEEG